MKRNDSLNRASKAHGSQLEALLGLKLEPVAIAFLEAPPPHVPRVGVVEPAGCAYWRAAAEGKVFYTEASDHYHCPIGAYTHGIPLPPEHAGEFERLIQEMVGLEYIKPEELPAIPHRTGSFGVAVYAPLAKAPCEPDVVLIRGNIRQLMLLAEAAQAAGMAGGTMMGRPTCAIIPEAIQSGKAVASFGCTGNRVYTSLSDDEGYYAIPGPQLAPVVEKLATIVRANRELETFHQARQALRIAEGQRSDL